MNQNWMQAFNKETGKKLFPDEISDSCPSGTASVSITILLDNSMSMHISAEKMQAIQEEITRSARELDENAEISVLLIQNSQILLISDFQPCSGQMRIAWSSAEKSRGMSPILTAQYLAVRRSAGRAEKNILFLLSDANGNDAYFYTEEELREMENEIKQSNTEIIKFNIPFGTMLYWEFRKLGTNDSSDAICKPDSPEQMTGKTAGMKPLPEICLRNSRKKLIAEAVFENQKNPIKERNEVMPCMILLDRSASAKDEIMPENFLALLNSFCKLPFMLDTAVIGVQDSQIQIIKPFTDYAEILTQNEENNIRNSLSSPASGISPVAVMLETAKAKCIERCLQYPKSVHVLSPVLILWSDFLLNDFSRTDAFSSPSGILSYFENFNKFVSESSYKVLKIHTENHPQSEWSSFLSGTDCKPDEVAGLITCVPENKTPVQTENHDQILEILIKGAE